MPLNLTPERGLIFRITHVANLPWLLANGLHCAQSAVLDPNFVAIGNADLIGKRSNRPVPIPPGGTLADYVPFYFTPKSPMLYNINTGYHGLTQRRNQDIAILVSSCRAMNNAKATVLFTDRHAYAATATWSGDSSELAGMIDWDILCRHDFSRSDTYSDKMERYQAEALVHGHVPAAALLGIGCAADSAKSVIETQIRAAGATLDVWVRPGWYF
jgi:hypothetical protein